MALTAPVLVDAQTPDARLYLDLAQETLQTAHTIAFSHLAQRYHEVMCHKIAQMEPHRRALARLFAAAMQDDAPQGIFPQDAMHTVFRMVATQATDAPTKEEDSAGLANLMYALYLLTVLFWLYDRTPQQRATAQLLDFTREMLRLLRPMLIMPLFSKALARLTDITGLVFRGMTPTA